MSSVTQTYWHRLIYNKMGNAVFEANISWSGSLVTRCTDTAQSGEHWYGNDFCARFVDKGIGSPDVVLINGGTNDVWKNSSVGVYLYPGFAMNGTACPDDAAFEQCFAAAAAARSRAEIEALDDTSFITAYIKLVSLIRNAHPQARVVMIVSMALTRGAAQAIHKIADHYGCRCVDFTAEGAPTVDMVNNHPTAAGFVTMAEYIYAQAGGYMD